MSKKSFEDKLRESLNSYHSPLDKEEMFQDFLQKSEKKEKKRLGLWLVLPLLLAGLTVLGVWWNRHERGASDMELIFSEDPIPETSAKQSPIQAASSAKTLQSLNTKTFSHEDTTSEDKELRDDISTSKNIDNRQRKESSDRQNSRLPSREMEKGLTRFHGTGQQVGIELPLRTVSTEVPVLESREAFLLLNKTLPVINASHSPVFSQEEMTVGWSQAIHLVFSYGHLSQQIESENTLISHTDRLGISVGKEWISPSQWTLGIQGGFLRYNLMQDGKVTLENSFDTLAIQAMLSMVQASLNGNFPGTPTSFETGYSLLQNQNAMQIGLSLGKLVPIQKKFEAEFNAALSSEYVWRSGGEWSNPERGVYLDYEFEDYRSFVVSLRTQFGLRMHMTHENFIRLGVSYHTDLSDRRSDSDLFRRFRGLGFYLGLSKSL
jgi:hypothetical protein